PHSVISGRANLDPGEAARIRGRAKIDKYRELASQVGMKFFPIVLETFGRLGESAQRIVKICAERIAARIHAPKASVLFYWRSRISFTLQQRARSLEPVRNAT